MVRSVVSMLCVGLILFVGSILESHYISVHFSEFYTEVSAVYDKVEEETATENDVYALQDKWLYYKKSLHAFVPHSEIKELDLWIAEAVKLVEKEKWEDALSKLEVIKELSEQIPKNFILSVENIL